MPVHLIKGFADFSFMTPISNITFSQILIFFIPTRIGQEKTTTEMSDIIEHHRPSKLSIRSAAEVADRSLLIFLVVAFNLRNLIGGFEPLCPSFTRQSSLRRSLSCDSILCLGQWQALGLGSRRCVQMQPEPSKP